MTQKKGYWITLIIITALSVGMNAFIVLQSCLDGAQSTGSSNIAANFFKAIINFFSPNAINEGNWDSFCGVIRKLIGHFGFFAISGVLTTLSVDLWMHPYAAYRPYKPFIISLSGGFFLAGLTELIQRFIPNRSGEFKDVLIDFGGYLLGAFLVFLVIMLIVTKKKKKLQNPSQS